MRRQAPVASIRPAAVILSFWQDKWNKEITVTFVGRRHGVGNLLCGWFGLSVYRRERAVVEIGFNKNVAICMYKCLCGHKSLKAS